MNKKITRLLNFFFVIILFYALIVNMHVQVYAASKGQYILNQPSSGLPTFIYYYGDGENDYVTYESHSSLDSQGEYIYFTLSEADKKKAPDAKTKGGYSIYARNAVDLQVAQKLSEESKKNEEKKAQEKADSGENVKTGLTYENGKLTYTYLDSDKKVHILDYKENIGYNGFKTFEITGEYTDEMKKAHVPKTIDESDLLTKYGINIHDKDDSEGDIGDGILGILLLGAKLGILGIGRIFSLVLGFFTDNGASLSVQDIIFNKVKITDINFFDIDGADGVIKTIRENVAAWYVGVRNLASVVLVIILIYVGIRMAISTIAEEKAKYKKMLIDWFTSMCLLFVLHFIIILTIQLNNTLVGAIGDASSTGDIAKQFLDNALNNVYLTKGMGNAICYLLLEAITFGFLIAYIKRMITIAFLIIIAPLVTITYSIDRMGDGSSQALNTWFKEFAYNILIQPFHCIAFLALCSTAVNLGEKANLGDATLAICLLAFLAKSAEDIVKRIFGFQAQSMASPVAAAALGYTLAQNTAKFTQKLRSSANGKAPKIPQDNNENGSASTTTPSRASQNNIQAANSDQQNTNNNTANRTNTTNTANLANSTNARANMPNSQIKQRKLTGKGIGGKAIRGFARGVINANKYALTMGTGLALGASQGDLGKTLAGTSFGLEIGQGWASNTAEKISGSHYKANTAKAFNNYKAKTGMSDEEISKRAMSLLKGDVEPENDNDKELKSALIDMTNYYRAEGSNEEESYKRTNQVLKDITSGAQGEETATSRFTGNIKERYYKQQAKSYRKKSLDTANYTQEERDEFKRKSEEAKQFIKNKHAREDFINRKE